MPVLPEVAVHGDFNVAASSPRLLRRPGRRGGPGKGQHAQAAKWPKILAPLMEFTSDKPTHYDASAHSVSALDRLWVSLPGVIACQIHAVLRVLGLPETLAEKEVSDHAAQSCSFSQRSSKPEEYRKIPRRIF
eukprot:1295256-Pyramimonas_sp.AAC.1